MTTHHRASKQLLIQGLCAIAVLIGAANARAANFYVDSAVATSGNGQSWNTAFKGFSSINWSAINPGDTLFISGGYTNKIYTSRLVVGKSGTSTNRISIRVGQDAGHNGSVIFEGVGIQSLQNYITINGLVGSERRIIIRNDFDVMTAENGVAVDAGGTTGLILENINIENCNNGVLLTRSGSYTVRNNSLTGIRGDYAIRGIISPGSWDANRIHGNFIETLYNDRKPAGTSYAYAGPDSIQPGDGTSIFDNHFVIRKTSNYTSAQHPDTIQLAGSEIKVYNNTFENIGDSNIDYDAWSGGSLRNIYIYNNLFRLVEEIDPYPEYMRFYSTGDALNSFSGLKIVNNTFIDARPTSQLAPRIGFGFGGGTGAGSGNEFRNNLVKGSYGFSISKDTGGTQFSIAFSNNIYPRAVALDTSGIIGTPVLDAAFVPAPADALARDRGVPVSIVTTDKLGTLRPQGGAIDIGAFEYTGGATAPMAPPTNLRVQ